jgi:signal recognition particle subunit SRP54
MTKAERADAALIDGSRRKRIAQGSGTSVQEVNRLLKQFADTRKMMKMVSSGANMKKMMTQGKGHR